MKKTFMTVILLIAFTAPVVPVMTAPAWAGWSDDWFDQKVSQAPGYFEGQKRGYVQGGSFNARWRNSTDSVVSIESPYIKGGCGGIDMFTGGISFMDFEYLVEKLQKVLQSAAGYAFQIGLKVLCEKCSSALEWITGITDALNNLQIDDCKAGKALVATVAKPFDFPNKDKVQGELNAAITDFKASSGYDNLYKRMQESLQSNENKASMEKADLDQMLEGCPADWKTIFAKDGSLLENLKDRLAVPKEYIDLIRGIVGDVKVTSANGVRQAQPVHYCEENGINPFDAFVQGKVYVRPTVDGACELISGKPIATKVSEMMLAIANKMRDKGTLTTEEAHFIDANPLSLQMTLKTAVGTSSEGAVVSTLSDATTKAYIHSMLADLYTRVDRLMNELQRVNSAGGTGKPETCRKEVASGVMESAADLPERLKTLVDAGYKELQKSYKELGVVYAIARHHQEFEKLAAAEMQRRFGGAMTARAMSKN